MIYTTYFAKISKLPPSVVPISIALKPPAGYTGAQFKQLAPSWSILSEFKQTSDELKYAERFWKEILGKLDCDTTVLLLRMMANHKDIALVCYERPESFCHRQLVAEWLRKHQYQCFEYNF